jgi:hypothetical protein
VIEIGKTIISRDLIDKKFVCDLKKCKGICCVEGDSGAPLEKKEIKLLEKDIKKIYPYLREEGRKAIEEQGVYVIDWDNEYVTPLINNVECAYAVFDGDIALCGIEKAYLAGATTFRKPISCYLYPVRVKKFAKFDAVNYDRWNICKPAVANGNELNVPVYRFLKKPLEQKFGKDWYNNLELVAEELKKANLDKE